MATQRQYRPRLLTVLGIGDRWLPASSTVIGYGSENQGTDKVHGAPLGDKDLANSKQRLGFDPEKKFYIPEDVRCFPHASLHER